MSNFLPKLAALPLLAMTACATKNIEPSDKIPADIDHSQFETREEIGRAWADECVVQQGEFRHNGGFSTDTLHTLKNLAAKTPREDGSTPTMIWHCSPDGEITMEQGFSPITWTSQQFAKLAEKASPSI